MKSVMRDCEIQNRCSYIQVGSVNSLCYIFEFILALASD